MNAITETKATHKGLYSALAAAQAEMGRARKDSKNPHFKSSYADLASVMTACMEALSRHNIAVTQPAGEDENGSRYVDTVLTHGETKEEARCRIPLIVAKNDMQGYGSAYTYARRYGLMAMAGVAADDDDGNAAAKSPPKDEPRRRSGPPPEAFEAAAGSLAQAETLDALKAIWGGLPKPIQANPDVIAAKDARKADLEACDAAEKPPVIDDDEIPYGGGA